MSYGAIGDASTDTSSGVRECGAGADSRQPPYAADAVSGTVELISYRADPGFMTATALTFENQQLVSIASNSEQWFPEGGTFADVGSLREFACRWSVLPLSICGIPERLFHVITPR